MINKTVFNIMNNMIKERQCNYDKCRRQDLKRFKICKRCKSVFYCNRKHQKLDWKNGKHREYCSKRHERCYGIEPKTSNQNDNNMFVSDINAIAIKLFKLLDVD